MRCDVKSCEFCEEMRDPRMSRFGSIYGTTLLSRTVRESASFIVVPTLGQIFACSLLVVPRRHVETLADLPEATGEMMNLISDLEGVLSSHGHVVFFEHGARSTTNGGCGIYHAHLHCVPLPRVASASELLPAGSEIGGLAEGWRSLASSRQYLIIRDAEKRTRFVDCDASSATQYGSQYFRRRIAEALAASAEWDWRRYTTPEPLMFHAIETFRAEAPQSARYL